MNKGDGGCLVTQNTHSRMHAHTSHTPPRILSEASCSPVRRLSHNTAHCEHVHAPQGRPQNTGNHLKQFFKLKKSLNKLFQT